MLTARVFALSCGLTAYSGLLAWTAIPAVSVVALNAFMGDGDEITTCLARRRAAEHFLHFDKRVLLGNAKDLVRCFLYCTPSQGTRRKHENNLVEGPVGVF